MAFLIQFVKFASKYTLFILQLRILRDLVIFKTHFMYMLVVVVFLFLIFSLALN